MRLSLLSEGFDFVNERPGDRIKHSEIVHLWDALRTTNQVSGLCVILRGAINSLGSVNIDFQDEEKDVLEIVGVITQLEDEVARAQSDIISDDLNEQVNSVVVLLRRYIDKYTRRRK